MLGSAGSVIKGVSVPAVTELTVEQRRERSQGWRAALRRYLLPPLERGTEPLGVLLSVRPQQEPSSGTFPAEKTTQGQPASSDREMWGEKGLTSSPQPETTRQVTPGSQLPLGVS